MTKFQAVTSTHTINTVVNDEPVNIDRPSIRQICRSGILAGKSTKEIAAEITAHHPDSAAAAKSGKHIAWYKATMKKAGEI